MLASLIKQGVDMCAKGAPVSCLDAVFQAVRILTQGDYTMTDVRIHEMSDVELMRSRELGEAFKANGVRHEGTFNFLHHVVAIAKLKSELNETFGIDTIELSNLLQYCDDSIEVLKVDNLGIVSVLLTPEEDGATELLHLRQKSGPDLAVVRRHWRH